MVNEQIFYCKVNWLKILESFHDDNATSHTPNSGWLSICVCVCITVIFTCTFLTGIKAKWEYKMTSSQWKTTSIFHSLRADIKGCDYFYFILRITYFRAINTGVAMEFIIAVDRTKPVHASRQTTTACNNTRCSSNVHLLCVVYKYVGRFHSQTNPYWPTHQQWMH